MKRQLMTVLSLACMSVFAQSPMIIEAPVDHLFVPNGFDNNDNVELIVTGKFPNPCYSKNNVEVNVKNDLISVNVTSLNSEDQSKERCEPLAVPFSEVINVGNLQAGDYEIRVNENGEYSLKDKLSVAVSSSNSVDDHLYAQVNYIDLGFTGGLSGDALLVGYKLSNCLAFDRVEYLDNGKDTISVLPIMKKINNICPEKKSYLSIPIKFDPGRFNQDRVLLFVRSIEGKSVHSIIDKH